VASNCAMCFAYYTPCDGRDRNGEGKDIYLSLPLFAVDLWCVVLFYSSSVGLRWRFDVCDAMDSGKWSVRSLGGGWKFKCP
jgi:hypothetical protein